MVHDRSGRRALIRFCRIWASGLTAFPGLTAVRLWRELRERGYAGGYTAVKRAVRDIRPDPITPFLGRPRGDEMQTVIAHGRHSARGIAVDMFGSSPSGGAMSGPCLTDAAPETAPGGLFVRESRYAEARTSTSAVVAAVCVRWCHLHFSIARAMT
jgi:hypothetical protein